jgi:hypothetical protein
VVLFIAAMANDVWVSCTAVSGAICILLGWVVVIAGEEGGYLLKLFLDEAFPDDVVRFVQWKVSLDCSDFL